MTCASPLPPCWVLCRVFEEQLDRSDLGGDGRSTYLDFYCAPGRTRTSDRLLRRAIRAIAFSNYEWQVVTYYLVTACNRANGQDALRQYAAE